MRWVMVTRRLPDGSEEAEPMTLEVEGDRLTFVLDDGERLTAHAREFAAELDYELAADLLARRDAA